MMEQAQKHLNQTIFGECIKSNYLLNNAVNLMDQDPERNIDDICQELRVSGRHLRRVFKDKVGISPKYYVRIKRLQKAVSLASSESATDFQEIIYACGYYDQSHFARDIKLFTGKKPTEFFNRNDPKLPSSVQNGILISNFPES